MALLWSECWLHQQGWWTHHGSLHHAERARGSHEKAQIDNADLYATDVTEPDYLVVSDAMLKWYSILCSAVYLARHTKYIVCPYQVHVWTHQIGVVFSEKCYCSMRMNSRSLYTPHTHHTWLLNQDTHHNQCSRFAQGEEALVIQTCNIAHADTLIQATM